MQPIKEQYASSNNLEARRSIYQYSIDPTPFSKWFTEQIAPESNARILELGCGTGVLWKDLKDSFGGCEIVLSDLSEGMLARAKENLGEDGFDYERIDFHNIPYPDRTFDAVISNHNLYHAVVLGQVLREIARVIKDNGVFYATTNSNEHLASLRELLNITDNAIWPNSVLTSVFGAETGMEILPNYFQSVARRTYQNELRIKDLAPILDYFMSVRDECVHHILTQTADKIRAKFERGIREYGYYRVKTKACLFICKKQQK